MKNKGNNNNNNKIFLFLLIIFVIIIIAVIFGSKNVSQERLDAFAMCLSDKKANFYGAFWCPHCEAQKSLLGNSLNIPYVECSTPDGKSQDLLCSSAGIKSYPTWRFADGQEKSGKLTLNELALLTGCQEPK